MFLHNNQPRTHHFDVTFEADSLFHRLSKGLPSGQYVYSVCHPMFTFVAMSSLGKFTNFRTCRILRLFELPELQSTEIFQDGFVAFEGPQVSKYASHSFMSCFCLFLSLHIFAVWRNSCCSLPGLPIAPDRAHHGLFEWRANHFQSVGASQKLIVYCFADGLFFA